MANMLLSLGKRVAMVTDPDQELERSGEPAAAVPLVTLEGPDSALFSSCQNGGLDKSSYDHVVAVEPSEEAAAVTYNEMKESNHLEDLSAQNTPGINTAGVSNWGGYAVTCGLFLLQTCPSHQRYLKKGLGLSEDQDEVQSWTTGLPSVEKVDSLAQTKDEQIITQLLQVTQTS